MAILVLGGTRSGKSEHAERLLDDAAAVRYFATGARIDTAADPEWAARVDAHRIRRGDRFETVEDVAGDSLAAQLRAKPTASVLVDDLGTWLTGVLDAAGAWDDPTVSITDTVADLCDAVAAHQGELVVVSPEVGLSVVAPTAAGRRFADELGAANTALARVCESVRLVVAGRVLDLPDDPSRHAASPTEPETAMSETGVPETPVSEMPPSVPIPAAVPVPSGTDARLSPATAATPAATASFAAEAPDGVNAEVFTAVDPPETAAADAARERHTRLTKPAGSLGLLEDLGVWISACQGQCPPKPIVAPAVAVFAGDHGVARDGVSAYPPEVTAQMVANISSGGAAVNVLARRLGATVHVFDLSVDADLPDGHTAVTAYKVRRASGDLRRGAAMTIAEARRAVAAGRDIADRLVDGGADLLIAGDMGIGNTTPAAVLIGTVTDREPVVVVGRGTGIDDDTWIRKTAAIRDGMRHGRRYRNEPLALIAAVGGPDLAAMAGFYAQAAVRRTPVLLDGVVTTSAALVAEQMAPGASAWWRAGHRSTEPAHGLALDELGLAPIVDLAMRLGEGTGALAALPAVIQGVDVLTEMATFADAGVSGAD